MNYGNPAIVCTDFCYFTGMVMSTLKFPLQLALLQSREFVGLERPAVIAGFPVTAVCYSIELSFVVRYDILKTC